MCILPTVELPLGDVLVASPSAGLRKQLVHSFHYPGREFAEAAAGTEALARLGQAKWQLLLLDRQLPDVDAAELREIILRRCARLPVLVFHRQRNAPSCREGNGSSPTPEYSRAASSVGCRPVRYRASDADAAEIQPLPGMVGASPVMQNVYRMARLVAPRNTTVLITGATGTGKELVARAIHQLSPRATRPFAVINCAAIPEALLESELFGYVRGAFTGAVQSQAGRVHAAQGGTLFLDEVGELPLSLQAKLLRFLEHKEVQRLGSSEIFRVDVRVIAASNADLARRVANREFREDLFYRLASFPIELPTLADRSTDIVPLAGYFLRRFADAPGARLSPEAAHVLQKHAWPGNVRELQFVLERACILAGMESDILPQHISFPYFFASSRSIQPISRAAGI